MTRYVNRYCVLTPIGWHGKTLTAGTTLQAEPDAKTEALCAQGAIRLDLDAHKAAVVKFDEPPMPQTLDSLTVPQLTELAAAQGIDLLGVKRKADIIELIEAAQDEQLDADTDMEQAAQEDIE